MNRKNIGCSRDGIFSADSTDKRFRSPNLTPSEKDCLFTLISKRLSILECKKTDVASLNVKNAEWQKICDEFNATSGIFFRTPFNLRAAWDNWKKAARKILKLNKSVYFSVRRDPFSERVLSVLLNFREHEPSIPTEKAGQDVIFNDRPQEIIEIVKADIFIPEDTFQSVNESCPADLSVDSNNADSTDQSPLESALQSLDVKKETFSNFVSFSRVSSCTSLSPPQDAILHTVPSDDPLRHTPPLVYQETSISPETSTSKSLWCVSNPSCEASTESIQCTLEKSSKHASCQTSDTISPEWMNGNEPLDLSRAKVEAIKVMTKNYAEEHRILQEYFAIKMLQEKEVLGTERRKHEIESERLCQEKIKSEMLLLQLEQLKRTIT